MEGGGPVHDKDGGEDNRYRSVTQAFVPWIEGEMPYKSNSAVIHSHKNEGSKQRLRRKDPCEQY